MTPWTLADQAPLSMKFSKQKCWDRLPFLPPGNCPDPGIKPAFLASPASLKLRGEARRAGRGKLYLQFSSVAQSCPTLCDPMNRSTPGLPVHHQLPEFTQTQVHRVRDAIQPSQGLNCPLYKIPNCGFIWVLCLIWILAVE